MRITATKIAPIMALAVVVQVLSPNALAGPSAARDPQKPNATAPSWVLSLLDVSKSVVDRQLGASSRENDYEVYSRPGFTVQVLFVASGSSGKSSSILVGFRKDPGSWQTALKQLGFDPKDVKEELPKPLAANAGYSYPKGYVLLNGLKGLRANWIAAYTPSHRGKNYAGEPYEADAEVSFFSRD
jgi:hypothetical protein